MGQFGYIRDSAIKECYVLFHRVSSGLADEIKDPVPVPPDFRAFPKGV